MVSMLQMARVVKISGLFQPFGPPRESQNSPQAALARTGVQIDPQSRQKPTLVGRAEIGKGNVSYSCGVAARFDAACIPSATWGRIPFLM
jgi:hypothetical protein